MNRYLKIIFTLFLVCRPDSFLYSTNEFVVEPTIEEESPNLYEKNRMRIQKRAKKHSGCECDFKVEGELEPETTD